MKIQVVGMGCPRCQAVDAAVRKALAAIGAKAELEHVYDPRRFASLKVRLTPALLVDGEIVLAGRVPDEAQVRALIEARMPKPS